MKRFGGAAAFVAAALLGGAAPAATFTFSETLDDGAVVTGMFDGDQDGNIVRNLTNVFVSVNGVAFSGSGSLGVGSLHGFSPDNTPGFASLDGTQNNFFISDAANVEAGNFSNYFSSYSAVSFFPYGDRVSTAAIDSENAGIANSFRAALAIVVPGAVPEPASWAMMVGGFGMVGAGLRRKRAIAAA